MAHRNTQDRLYRKIKRNNCYYDIYNRNSQFNQVMTRRSHRAQIEESLGISKNSSSPQIEAPPRPSTCLLLRVPRAKTLQQPETRRETSQATKRKSKLKQTSDSIDQSDKVLSRAQRDRRPSRKILESCETSRAKRARKILETVEAVEILKDAKKSKNVTSSAERALKTLKKAKATSKKLKEADNAKVLEEIEETSCGDKELEPVDQNVAFEPVIPAATSDFCDQIAKAEDLGFNIVNDDDFWTPKVVKPAVGDNIKSFDLPPHQPVTKAHQPIEVQTPPTSSSDQSTEAKPSNASPVIIVNDNSKNYLVPVRPVATTSATNEEPVHVWPNSLRNYVTRCFGKCKTATEKDQLEKILWDKLMKMVNDGSLWDKNWDREPLLSVHKLEDALDLSKKGPSKPLKAKVKPSSPVISDIGKKKSIAPVRPVPATSTSKRKLRDWPDSWKKYVIRCFEVCKTPTEKEQLEQTLRDILMIMASDGSLWIKDWNEEPVLNLYSQQMSILSSRQPNVDQVGSVTTTSANRASSVCDWPDCLTNYVKRCYEKCKTAMDKNYVEIIIKGKITRASYDGSLWEKNWDREPLPSLYYSERMTVPVKPMNRNKLCFERC